MGHGPLGAQNAHKAPTFFFTLKCVILVNFCDHQGQTTLEPSLPGISQGHYKPSVQVKVTNMQLTSPPVWGPSQLHDDDPGPQRGKQIDSSGRGFQIGD